MGAQLDAGGGKGKKKSASPDINVTPLVDVCLVLLIIFMVATPEMDKNAQVDLPAVDTPDKKSQAKKNPLEVTISAKGEVTAAKKPYNMEDLEALLRKEKEADPENGYRYAPTSHWNSQRFVKFFLWCRKFNSWVLHSP